MPALIGIAVVIFIIYLYVSLMGWLFENVFLDVFIGTALAALLVAPIVYGFGAFRTFPTQSDWHWRDLLWVPIAALLIFIYADLVVLLDSAIDGMFRGHDSPAWLRWQESEIQNWLHTQFHGYADVLRHLLHPLFGLDPALPGGALRVYALVGLVVKISLVLILLLGVRGLHSEYEDGTEPAHRQYFFGDAYRDMQRLLEASWNGIAHYYERSGTIVESFFASDASVVTWVVIVFVWPLAIAAVIGLFVMPMVLGALFLPLIFLIHALALALVGLLFVGAALMLSLIERGVLFVRSGWAKCPHPGCYKTVALPVYRCPGCGAKHKRLLPGRCGVLQRQCKCGRLLPTFSWLGKQKLPAECSHCGGELPHALFSSNLILPIYGGPAAGKTMFKHAGVVRLLEGHQPDLGAELIVDREQRDYEARLKPAFERGQPPPKTTSEKPHAYLLSLRRAAWLGLAGRPVSVYLYDPAGETNELERHLDQQHYLRHLGGLALLIDPLSFASLKTAFESTGHSLPDGTCRSDPLDLVERVHEALEKHTGLRPSQRFRRRLAIVLTKGDIPFVQRELGVLVDGKPPHAVWHSSDRETSDRIRDWLRGNEPAFLHALETHFASVRFFIVSAMGHDARERRPFEPKRVLEPLLWLLSSRNTLRRPVLMRWGMTAAEVAIVAVLIAVFSVLPIAGASIAQKTRQEIACVLYPGCKQEQKPVVIAPPLPRPLVPADTTSLPIQPREVKNVRPESTTNQPPFQSPPQPVSPFVDLPAPSPPPLSERGSVIAPPQAPSTPPAQASPVQLSVPSPGASQLPPTEPPAPSPPPLSDRGPVIVPPKVPSTPPTQGSPVQPSVPSPGASQLPPTEPPAPTPPPLSDRGPVIVPPKVPSTPPAQTLPEQKPDVLETVRRLRDQGRLSEALLAADKGLDVNPGSAEIKIIRDELRGRIHEASLDSRKRERTQKALTLLGFDTKGVDGDFGPNTRSAIRRFQQRQRAPETGWLTDDQWAILMEKAKPLLNNAEKRARPRDPPPQGATQAKPSSRIALPAGQVECVGPLGTFVVDAVSCQRAGGQPKR